MSLCACILYGSAARMETAASAAIITATTSCPLHPPHSYTPSPSSSHTTPLNTLVHDLKSLRQDTNTFLTMVLTEERMQGGDKKQQKGRKRDGRQRHGEENMAKAPHGAMRCDAMECDATRMLMDGIIMTNTAAGCHIISCHMV